jgi:hypothetical protein
MDRVMERTMAAAYGVDVEIQGGHMVRATLANGTVHDFA